LIKNRKTICAGEVLVGIGSNLPGRHGRTEDQLVAALDQFSGRGLTIVARSGWWRSAAWPDPAMPAYTNGVVVVETAFGPLATLEALNRIEEVFGRKRDQPNASRTLDLDLIAHGETILEGPDLELPHPRAHLRRFVMGPLAEILPTWRHPVLQRTAIELLAGATVGLDAYRL
jgi:2-amino-4-hydroxy-6-hydroxymethyldihydropteridine diphosphokinase